jgi:predicted Fe-Mo cluster-binding NifX family protein
MMMLQAIEKEQDMGDHTRIAVPSVENGGLDGERSAHFGHCDCFTVVDVSDGKVVAVETIANTEHAQGGCLAPVALLASSRVDSLIVAGIGMRPLAGFKDAAIRVFIEQVTPRVGTVIDMLIAGSLPEMDAQAACSGGCGH